MPLRPGETIGGYRIQKVLGAGGMGTVYLAKHPNLPRMYALKVLKPELTQDDEFRLRFQREGSLAASLDHPNLISVHNRGEEDGQLWIAMAYIEGTDAAVEVEKGPLVMTMRRALRIITEVGKGLDYAHGQGLLHRDVKPANFLLSGPDPADERVVLTDFGVARSAEDNLHLTQTGTFIATMAYAAPEQLLGQPLDHRTDIYGLACALMKLLTGYEAFPSPIPAKVMMGHLHEPPPRPSTIRGELPPAIDAVIAKAMAKDKADRYDSCREFAEAATAALTEAPHATGPVGTYAPYQAGPQQLYASGPQPTYQHPGAAFTGPNGQFQPPPKPARSTGLIVGISAAVLALIVGVGIAVAVTNSGGDSSSRTAANSSAQAVTTTKTGPTTTSVFTSAAPATSEAPISAADCQLYDGIKADVDAAIAVKAPDHSDRAKKYRGIADEIDPVAAQMGPGKVKDYMNQSSTAARQLADLADRGGASEDELEGLRLQFVDPWTALSFLCL